MDARPFGLTEQEFRVVESLLKLGVQKLVARELGIEMNTLQWHLKGARKKAKAASTMQLVVEFDRATREAQPCQK